MLYVMVHAKSVLLWDRNKTASKKSLKIVVNKEQLFLLLPQWQNSYLALLSTYVFEMKM